MLTVLIATAKHENLRREVARIAVDHGLTQKLPFLFEGELTPYRRAVLLRQLKRCLAGKRAFHMRCFTTSAVLMRAEG